MRRLMIALMCSMGVGLTLMAAPAPVGEENGAGTPAGATVIHPYTPRHDGHRCTIKETPPRFRQAWKIKKLMQADSNAPKLKSAPRDPNPQSLYPWQGTSENYNGKHPIPEPRPIGPQGYTPNYYIMNLIVGGCNAAKGYTRPPASF